jgi:hypothetical protein
VSPGAVQRFSRCSAEPGPTQRGLLLIAGLDRWKRRTAAPAHGYFMMHPSGGYVTFTQAGADLFAQGPAGLEAAVRGPNPVLPDGG